MTQQAQENQVQIEQKPNDKEYNFRALEAKYQQERAARLQAEREAQEAKRMIEEAASKRSLPTEEDDDDNEPYVDKKKLNKFGQNLKQTTQSEIQKAMELAKQKAKEELKQEMYLEANPDFFQTLQHADKFAEKNPRLAESILRMPEGFERQRLVYENIKALGVDRPEQKQPSIQDKIDANRRSPYYQPTGVNAPPSSFGGDYSAAGQKNAYDKMQELKRQLRI